MARGAIRSKQKDRAAGAARSIKRERTAGQERGRNPEEEKKDAEQPNQQVGRRDIRLAGGSRRRVRQVPVAAQLSRIERTDGDAIQSSFLDEVVVAHIWWYVDGASRGQYRQSATREVR